MAKLKQQPDIPKTGFGLPIGVLDRIFRESDYRRLLDVMDNVERADSTKKSSITGQELDARFDAAADVFFATSGDFFQETTNKDIVTELKTNVRNRLHWLLLNSEIQSEAARERLKQTFLTIPSKVFSKARKSKQSRRHSDKRADLNTAQNKVNNAIEEFCNALSEEYSFIEGDLKFDTHGVQVAGPRFALDSLSTIVNFWVNNPKGDPQVLVTYLNDNYNDYDEWQVSDVMLSDEAREAMMEFLDEDAVGLAALSVLDEVSLKLEEVLHVIEVEDFLSDVQDEPLAYESFLNEMRESREKWSEFLGWVKLVDLLRVFYEDLSALCTQLHKHEDDALKTIDFSMYEQETEPVPVPKPVPVLEPKPEQEPVLEPKTAKKTKKPSKPSKTKPKNRRKPDVASEVKRVTPCPEIDFNRLVVLHIVGQSQKNICLTMKTVSDSAIGWTKKKVSFSEDLRSDLADRYNFLVEFGLGAHATKIIALELFEFVSSKPERAAEHIDPQMVKNISAMKLNGAPDSLLNKIPKEHHDRIGEIDL